MNDTWRRYRTSRNILSRNVFLLFSLLFTHFCVAQESIEDSMHSMELKKVVIPSKGDTLNARTIDTYKTLIPPEITPLISQKNVSVSLKALPLKKPTHTLDSEQKAPEPYEILKSFESILAETKISLTQFQLRTISLASPPWRVQGEWSRLYLHAIDKERSGDQYMREKISITSPLNLSRYSWLTFRFLGASEDLVWIYTPILKKDRQVVSSLRTDPLFFSALSSEDLFTWSGKVDVAEARVLSVAPYLLPTMHRIEAPSISNDRCQSQDREKLGTPQWKELQSFDASAWLPIGETFSPYNAYRIEIINKDPYSLYGKQILYVHAQSKLPLLKIVYDRKGVLFKVIYSSIALSPNEESSPGVRYWVRYTSALDLKNQQTSSFESKHTTYCAQFIPNVQLKHFDPTQLGVDAQ